MIPKVDLSNLDPHKAYCIYADGQAHEVVPLLSPKGLTQFRDIWREEYRNHLVKKKYEEYLEK